MAFELKSPAFEHGSEIPQRHTCEGEDVSPSLTWSGVPDGAASLALIVDDPDAPVAEPFVHWLAWGIDPAAGGLAEDESAPTEGASGFGDVGYRGPCPPPGHGPHRYFFRLHALDAAIEGHVLETAELIGTYERN